MPRQRSLTLLCALVVIMPCGAIALIANATIYPILAGGFLLAAIANPRPLTATTRAIAYSLTIAALFAYIINLVAPINSDRFFFPLIEYLFPFTICMAVCLTFLQPSQVRLSLIVMFSALAMMIEGSCITNPHDSPTAHFGPLWRNRFWIYGIFVILQTICLVPLLLQTQRFGLYRCALPQTQPRRQRLTFLYSLGLVACFAIVGAQLTLHAERILEPTFRRILNFYFELYQPRVVFDGSVDLNRKNSPFVAQQSQRIMLRAVSEQAPGYLRGRVYEDYAEGTWKGIERADRLHAEHDEDLASIRFERETSPDTARTIDIHPARRFYSDVLLACGPARSVELIADSVSTNRNGELQPQAWDRGGSYSMHLPEQEGQAFYGPKMTGEELYLKVPLDVQLPLASYAAAQFPAFLRPRQRVAAVETHLQEACEYELGINLPGTRDPVLEFLLEERRGHCELYATTAVMLLRVQGIPARYVTGFVCMERHPLEGCYISRLGDCHAWAEAWLADEQRWVLVEATPPSGLPDSHSRAGFFAKLFEMPRTAWQKLYSNIKRGHFAVAVLAFFADIGGMIAQLFWGSLWMVGWGILIVLGVLAGLWWRRRHPPEAPIYRQFHAVLRELERRLQKLGVDRPANATVATLANTARELRTPQAEHLADLLLRYQQLRFQPELSLADLDGLRSEIRDCN